MKTGILLLFFLFLVSCGCGEKKKENSKVNNETKTVNPDIVANKNHQTKTVNPDTVANNKAGERRLRYLFFSKAGLRGFYNDGTIGLCPKCDFSESSVNNMKDAGVFSKYTVEKDGSLLINGNEKAYPVFKGLSGADWAMIDYVWKTRPGN